MEKIQKDKTLQTKELDYVRGKFGAEIKTFHYESGSINSTWLIVQGKKEVVVRFYPPFFDEKLSIETWILRELESVGDKTPKLLGFDTYNFETPVLFLSKIPGIPLVECLELIDGEGYRLLFRELWDFFEKASLIPVKNVGYLHDNLSMSSISQYIAESSEKYLENIGKAQFISVSQDIAIRKCLMRLQVILSEQQIKMTYPDLSLNNILVSNGCFSGIVDWEFVMGFDPMYSFGNLFCELEFNGKTSQKVSKILLDFFSGIQREKLLLLAMLRVIELMNYLPTTRLYKASVKKSRLKNFKRVLCELQNLYQKSYNN